jgi:hypothetical protein
LNIYIYISKFFATTATVPIRWDEAHTDTNGQAGDANAKHKTSKS